MSIPANTLISGATALAFQDLAEVQAAEAQMEINNLNMYANGKTGFFTVEQSANTASMTLANQQADDQMAQGIAQCVGSVGDGLTGLGGVFAGEYKSGGDTAAANELENEINAPKMQATLEEQSTLQENNGAFEMTEIRSTTAAPAASEGSSLQSEEAIITGANSAKANADTQETGTVEKATEANKAKQAQIDNLRTRASMTQSRFQNLGTIGGKFINGVSQAANGYYQQDATKAAGRSQFMQGISTTIFKQVGDMTSAAIQAEQGQEQTTAQAYLSVVSLTGAARG